MNSPSPEIQLKEVETHSTNMTKLLKDSNGTQKEERVSIFFLKEKEFPTNKTQINLNKTNKDIGIFS